MEGVPGLYSIIVMQTVKQNMILHMGGKTMERGMIFFLIIIRNLLELISQLWWHWIQSIFTLSLYYVTIQKICECDVIDFDYVIIATLPWLHPGF